ncbi:MAG: hypothetical protein M3Q07_05210 [Pseudobdellovibrionaceae bacterium]|nr:hypothetical protein [Pseudobdellovibrionaceae bacterium]
MSVICQRKHSISLLFSNDPDLLDFFFTRDHQSFGWESASEAAFVSGMMKKERAILVRAALDVWNSTGFFRLSEAFENLGPDRSECLMLALETLFQSRGCHCLQCSHRLHPSPRIASEVSLT